LEHIIGGKMRYRVFCRLLASGIMIALLLSVFAASPAAGASLKLTPAEGKVGDWVDISYSGDGTARFYFSSDKADIGDKIGNQVRAYLFITIDTFKVPDRLEDGTHKEDVHGGEYYLYAAGASKEIVAVATFTVIKGEIQLEPEEGSVGDEVGISGEELGPGQAVTIKYGVDKVDIISGDTMTDGDGKFSCTIIIPYSVVGEHTVVVADQSGDRPEAIFTVKPKITLAPAQQGGGKAVEVNGTGFGAEFPIKLTLDSNRVETTPNYIETDLKGSFSCIFAAPLYEHPTIKVVATDRDLNKAETQLTVLSGIRLGPVITPDSPGNVGMEITIYGVGFASGATVNISYYNGGDEVISQATATADADGNFTTLFTVPPSVAGDHLIEATDGAITTSATFIMESAPPPMPVLNSPGDAGTAQEEARFDWGDVTDPSGVSYTLQVASDIDFTTLLVNKQGLPLSEYTLTSGEKLAPAGQKAYYWRVRAVDGASNEGQWSVVGLFYVGFSRTAMAGGLWYILYGVIALVLASLVFWFYRRRHR
jgi:hypothetical protein